MYATNICLVQYSTTFLPYKAVMDPTLRCKKCDKGKGRMKGRRTRSDLECGLSTSLQE